MSAVLIKPNALFQLGSICMTPGIKELKDDGQLTNAILLKLIYRHQCGDWSDCSPEDAETNRQALSNGSRIFSVYQVTLDLKIWIITEAEDDKGNRCATTLLLPSEY